jgi:ribosomal protein S2
MIKLENMLASGTHLGHPISKWNPKMYPYIYGHRNGIHIIDVLQTILCLRKACDFLYICKKKQKTCDLKIYIVVFINFVCSICKVFIFCIIPLY